MPTTPEPPIVHDTLIIGGGPGGLTAAIYLRRFTRNVALVDKGNSRLAMIPVSHNYPGFPEGVGGQQLLRNLQQQLARYGGAVIEGEVSALRLEDGTFVADYEGGQIRALTVLVATGVADAGLPVEDWRDAVASGAIRLCPVCDGYDVIDKKVAVVSSEVNPVGHALFMRTFTTDVTLFARTTDSLLTGDERQQIEAAGIGFVSSPVVGVSTDAGTAPVVHTAAGDDFAFDVVYPMLGETARSGLASALGARTGDCDNILVDEFQRTSVPGLYAIGDVVQGLNQISVATGQAAIAATRIHNTLPWRLRARPEGEAAGG